MENFKLPKVNLISKTLGGIEIYFM